MAPVKRKPKAPLTPEALAEAVALNARVTREQLQVHGLPRGTVLLVVGNGKARHVASYVDERYPTLCKAVGNVPDRLRLANLPNDWKKVICGSCLRTLPAAWSRRVLARPQLAKEGVDA